MWIWQKPDTEHLTNILLNKAYPVLDIWQYSYLMAGYPAFPSQLVILILFILIMKQKHGDFLILLKDVLNQFGNLVTWTQIRIHQIFRIRIQSIWIHITAINAQVPSKSSLKPMNSPNCQNDDVNKKARRITFNLTPGKKHSMI